ncbi:T-cell surface antigen CD2-like isoform X2 [Siniperca chuatsi]|uniref:T-cell surface antigen CD2-like isoform X2 n=2 Tax=Siniperca chuatsi TaxID=119488 RepID=UPI001CE0C259|nr:T-cell surface antigen CD2-like isoform X2 [Siniperca chuatsi]
MESGCSSFQLNIMMMKMAAVSTITLFLLCCSFASTDSKDCDYNAATGGNYTVILAHKLTSSNRLKWMRDSKVIVHRRQNNVFVEGTKENIYENGSLKLTNLQKSDAGKYYPEVHDSDGKQIPNLKGTRLCILDPVPMPRVIFKCSPSVSLTCNIDQADNPSFQWFHNNKVLTKKTNQTLILEDKKMHKDSFHCEVSNAISSLKSTTVDNPCFDPPKPFFPDKVLGINTWIFVGGGGGVVLVLIIIVIVCCIQTRRKKRLQLKDEGELRLAWTSEQQHQHQHQHNHPPDQQHHHHHHHQQQPAGHTGPRQHRSKQHHNQQRTRAPNPSHPQPSPRRPAQAPPIPVDNDDEQPPPLPQPRKKAPKSPRV